MTLPIEDEARLQGLLDRMLELCGRVLALTIRQAGLLEEDDPEGFGRSLDERGAAMDEIDGLHQESEALMQSYISIAGRPGGGRSQKIEGTLEKIRDALSRSAAANEKNLAAAKEKAGDYVRQIGKMSLGKKSVGAYIQGVPNNPEHFDIKM